MSLENQINEIISRKWNIVSHKIKIIIVKKEKLAWEIVSAYHFPDVSSLVGFDKRFSNVTLEG